MQYQKVKVTFIFHIRQVLINSSLTLRLMNMHCNWQKARTQHKSVYSIPYYNLTQLILRIFDTSTMPITFCYSYWWCDQFAGSQYKWLIKKHRVRISPPCLFQSWIFHCPPRRHWTWKPLQAKGSRRFSCCHIWQLIQCPGSVVLQNE